MKKKEIKITFILLLLLNLLCVNFVYADSIENSYIHLLEKQSNILLAKGDFYNSIFYDSYNESIEIYESTPYSSYLSLIEHYQSYQIENIENIDDLLSNIYKEIKLLRYNISSFTPNTISSYEWISLAIHRTNSANNVYNLTKEYFLSEGNSISTKSYLKSTLIYLTEAFDCYSLALLKNDVNKINNSELEFLFKITAKNWISLAEKTINYSKRFGETDSLSIGIEMLKDAKDNFNSSSYYIALMFSAHAKALADFLLFHPLYSSRNKGLTIANSYYNMSDLYISMLGKSNIVDGPIAILNSEQAFLHLNDAKKEKSDGSMAIASISIKESCISAEQAKATLSIQYESTLNHQFDEIQEGDTTKISQDSSLGIFPFLILIFICFTIISRKHIGRKR